MSELDPEDAKLITLARSVRARSAAGQGAAVRDTDGRTYVASSVDLPHLALTALQLAVAMAVSSGALGLEAAVILGADSDDVAGEAVLRDVAPQAALITADSSGQVMGKR